MRLQFKVSGNKVDLVLRNKVRIECCIIFAGFVYLGIDSNKLYKLIKTYLTAILNGAVLRISDLRSPRVGLVFRTTT